MRRGFSHLAVVESYSFLQSHMKRCFVVKPGTLKKYNIITHQYVKAKHERTEIRSRGFHLTTTLNSKQVLDPIKHQLGEAIGQESWTCAQKGQWEL